MNWQTFYPNHPGWNIKILTRLDDDDSTIEEVYIGSEFTEETRPMDIVKSENFKKHITTSLERNEKRPKLYWCYKT